MSGLVDKAALARERKKQLAEERRIEAEQQAERRRVEAEQRKIEEEQRRLEEIEKLRIGMKVRPAFDMLQSELTGLYDEMDKLAKKAPNEPITDLQLKILNSFIRKAKYLLSKDTIINEVEIFVAAGNNPEYRDVVTVLRQIRQGLERYKITNNFIFGVSFTSGIEKYSLGNEEPSDFFADMNSSKDGVTE
jgi:poly-D-alanine transfer protein DltD